MAPRRLLRRYQNIKTEMVGQQNMDRIRTERMLAAEATKTNFFPQHFVDSLSLNDVRPFASQILSSALLSPSTAANAAAQTALHALASKTTFGDLHSPTFASAAAVAPLEPIATPMMGAAAFAKAGSYAATPSVLSPARALGSSSSFAGRPQSSSSASARQGATPSLSSGRTQFGRR